MKNNKKKLHSKIILIVAMSLFLLMAYYLYAFYIETLASRISDAKSEIKKECFVLKKQKGEMIVNQIHHLYQTQYEALNANIEKELQQRVNRAYRGINTIYTQYEGRKSKKKIKKMIKILLESISANSEQNSCFIKNFYGDSVVPLKVFDRNIDYLDADMRSIVLEQIQKVRKKGEGFLYSKYAKDEPEEIYYVKKLNMYNWYIGSRIFKKEKHTVLKQSFLQIIKNIPMNNNEFISLRDSNKALVQTAHIENSTKEYSIHSKYFKPLDFYITYGFKIAPFKDKKAFSIK